MNRGMLAAVACWFLAATPAAADYRSEYNAYMAANDAGDREGALRHGEAAWRAAEAELGDHQSTGILAYNFARLAYASNPAKALEAFKRAAAITAQGKGPLSANELALTIAELEVRLDLGNEAKADALETALRSLAGSNALAEARGWRTLALVRLGSGDLFDSKRAADRAIEIASGLDPKQNRLLAEALIVGAISRLAKFERTERDIAEAVALFGDAFSLFPPQADIDHFDPLLARALSWRHSIIALVNSSGPLVTYGSTTRLATGEELERAYKRAVARQNPDEWFQWKTPRPAFCEAEIRWLSRKPPKYPRRALRKMHIGSIIVGYHLNDVGVEHAVVLADFPESAFGEAAVESMKAWRLEQPPPAECRHNNATYFVYVIERR